jgi:hypothetical protein
MSMERKGWGKNLEEISSCTAGSVDIQVKPRSCFCNRSDSDGIRWSSREWTLQTDCTVLQCFYWKTYANADTNIRVQNGANNFRNAENSIIRGVPKHDIVAYIKQLYFQRLKAVSLLCPNMCMLTVVQVTMSGSNVHAWLQFRHAISSSHLFAPILPYPIAKYHLLT